MTRIPTLTLGLLAALGLAAALAVGFRWGRSQGDPAPAAPARAPATATTPAAPRVLYWYDPMVPDQHFDKPGKSPFMDMQLVPKYAEPAVAGDAGADAAGGSAAGVRISPRVQQNLGVRTALVTHGRLPAGPPVPATVGWDLREERVVSLPVDASSVRLAVRTPFERVRTGQVLARVQAPAWAAALAEARALRGAQSAEAADLGAAARARLGVLGLPAGARLDAQGAIGLAAPQDGVVSEIFVRDGQAVPAGAPLLRLNGDDQVWVELAVPQARADDLRIGAVAQVTVDAFPGKTFSGRIEAVLPQVEATTRTRRVRVVVDYPDAQLAAGMFAEVALEPGGGEHAVLVPTAAIINDGMTSRVLVRKGERFVPVAVRTGRAGAGLTEVLAGLSGGERVVVSGQFLIDSEANLSGALDRIGTP